MHTTTMEEAEEILTKNKPTTSQPMEVVEQSVSNQKPNSPLNIIIPKGNTAKKSWWKIATFPVIMGVAAFALGKFMPKFKNPIFAKISVPLGLAVIAFAVAFFLL